VNLNTAKVTVRPCAPTGASRTDDDEKLQCQQSNDNIFREELVIWSSQLRQLTVQGYSNLGSNAVQA